MKSKWFRDLPLRAKLTLGFGLSAGCSLVALAVVLHALDAATVALEAVAAGGAGARGGALAAQAAAAGRAWTTGLAAAVLTALVALGATVVITRSVTGALRAVGGRAEQLRTRDIASLQAMAEGLAHGDFSARAGEPTRRLHASSPDELGDLARTLNGVIDATHASLVALGAAQGTVGAVTTETTALARAAQAGELETRGDAARFDGAYRELVAGVNATLDAVVAPIGEAAAVLDRVAARDLAARVSDGYRGGHARIATAINTAVGNLDAALAQVDAAAHEVAAGAGHITAGSETLAAGATEQAAGIESVRADLVRLADTATRTAASAQEAAGIADDAGRAVHDGTAGMTALHEAMGRIKASSDATARIVKTIDEIAF